MQQFGRTHSRLVSSIYLKTLQIDKRFLAKEPDWTDPVYIAKQILVFSAAQIQPKILAEAPSFFAKHLNYFKDKYPEYFRLHPQSAGNAVANDEQQDNSEESRLASTHSKLLLQIHSLFSASNTGRQHVLTLAKNSFTQIQRRELRPPSKVDQ